MKKHTLFILDWDDTLFPTHWIVNNNINLLNPDVYEQYKLYFTELDNVLYKFLSKMVFLGKIIIVTNAISTWVHVASSVLPQSQKLLKYIRIVSARELYQNTNVLMEQWKILTFQEIINKEFINSNFMNIISIGDAEYEYNALVSLDEHVKNAQKYLKTIKLMQNPEHDVLVEQLEVLLTEIPKICISKGHLDLKFDKLN